MPPPSSGHPGLARHPGWSWHKDLQSPGDFEFGGRFGVTKWSNLKLLIELLNPSFVYLIMKYLNPCSILFLWWNPVYRQVLCFISSTHPQQESKAFPGWPSCAWCFQWHQPLLAPKLPKLSLNISELKSTSIGCSSTSDTVLRCGWVGKLHSSNCEPKWHTSSFFPPTPPLNITCP